MRKVRYAGVRSAAASLWERSAMLRTLEEQFRDPPSWFRSAPFWSWNDRLDARRIRRQIRQMKRAGIGGFFMHSRGGLVTPFLSAEWFAACDAAVDEARKQGMLAWVYDEDRWPSGAAGGIVTQRFPEAAGRFLEVAVEPAYPAATAGMVACFARRGRMWKSVSDIPKNCSGPFLVFYERSMEPVDWFNGWPPLDVLNREAVRRFVDVAYRPYVERYRQHLGTVVPGVFTDEPNFAPGRALRGSAVPWGRGFREEFLKRRGYDIADYLPALLGEPVAGRRRPEHVRCDFWQTLAELFAENFSAQIGRFCARHGIALTGHYLCEESLIAQTRVSGAVMPHYVHQQVPGIDILCRRTTELLTVKQASSVAHQWGRERLLSELYGASGWDFTLEDQKRIGDWQYALGVNYRCQHLCLYSIRGERKRDFPPSHMPHQPWWKHYRLVEDYFARVSLALSLGEPLREVGVIHPIRSVWANMTMPLEARRAGGRIAEEVDRELYRLADQLLYSQIDFDFIDEMLLAEYGRFRNGRLFVNKAGYRLLVVPYVTHLAASTAQFLLQAARNGLDVFFAGSGRVKVYECGQPQGRLRALEAELNALLRRCRVAVEELPERLRSLMREPVRIEPAARVLYQLRGKGRQRILFLTNQEERPVEVRVTLKGGRDLTLWDAEAGKRYPYYATVDDDGVVFDVRLERAGSALFTYIASKPGKEPARAGAVQAGRSGGRFETVRLDRPMAYRLDSPNVLLLDRATISVTGADVKMTGFVPQIGRKVRAMWGYPDGCYHGRQPWAWPKMPPSGRQVVLAYAFEVKDLPRGAVLLGVERPERKEIRLNGRPVNNKPQGFYLDEDIRTIRLPKLKRGVNVIEVREDLDIEFEAEPLYLLGEFGVADQKVVRLPQRLRPGDWTRQGLEFYAGSVTYLVAVTVPESGRYEVEVAFEGAAVVGLGVQGGRIRYRAFSPWRFEVDLQAGQNVLEVQLINTLRNLMGPHHAEQARPVWVGPGELAPAEPVDRYVHIPSGLYGLRLRRAG